MKKTIIINLALFSMASTVEAQLNVNYDYKVGIGTAMEYFQPKLMVGDNTLFNINASIGMAGAPATTNGNNIGINGRTINFVNYSSDKNYGALGIVESASSTHGRNYGLAGMISNPGTSNYYGGAGIYATSNNSYYVYPVNIQGAYAAYFAGSVHATGNLSSLGMFTTSDSRLCENVAYLDEIGGSVTLEKLLGINVVEFFPKSRLESFSSNDIADGNRERAKGEYELLKQEDLLLMCRRHYGVDAQELQKTYPGLVLEGQDGTLSVNYLEMVPLLVRSLQELKQEMDEMKDGSKLIIKNGTGGVYIDAGFKCEKGARLEIK